MAVPEVKNELCDKVHRLDIHSTFTNSTVSLSFSLSVSLSFCLSFPVSLSVRPPVACSYVVAHSQISHTHTIHNRTQQEGGSAQKVSKQKKLLEGSQWIQSAFGKRMRQRACKVYISLCFCVNVCVRVICTLSFKFLRGLRAYIPC